jgi:predicted CXXCH cytochrome family protein
VQVLIRNIVRKSRGGIAAKEQTVDAEVLLVGRGNDCGIHLPDPRVLLHHAEFTLRKGDLYVAPASGADVRVNGNLTQMIRLAVGDVIKIGPYDLTLEANNQSGQVTLAVELVQALGEDIERILAQSSVRTGRLSIRSLSWTLALTMAFALFAAPWIMSWFHEPTPRLIVLNTRDRAVPSAPTEIWSSGGISSAHKFFGDSCETCHVKAFIPVADVTCLTCHEGIEHHADPQKFAFASFEERTCQNCHKEHQGNQTIALSNQGFCTDCHKDFAKDAPKSDLLSAADFGTAHPDFKPTVVTDSALHTIDRSTFMSATPPPREDSSLDFPHDRHMRTGGVRDPVRGNVQLECTNCHQADGGGGYMLPISFDKHCHQCHALKFDVFVPDRELMHGKPEEMFKQVRDIYDAVAMRGGYTEPEAPELIRRRPGTPLTTAQKKEALDWSAAKAEAILNGRFGRGQCDSCHKIFESTASGGPTGAGWGVEPVSAANIWYPKSRFTHSGHRDMECGTCHQAKTSVTSADVLMPAIGTCRACHGGEHATDKVPSTCISCHGFHRDDLDPMKKVAEAPHATNMSAAAKP